VGIRETVKLWLEPKRWFDDLEWVYKKGFLSFVVFWGVVRFGFMAAGVFSFWLAFASDGDVISLRAWRIGLLLWLAVGAVWAAVGWLCAYWHFKNHDVD